MSFEAIKALVENPSSSNEQKVQDAKVKIDQLDLTASSSSESLLTTVDFLSNEAVPLPLSRGIISAIADAVKGFAQTGPNSNAIVRPLCEQILAKLDSRAVPFEEQISFFREALAQTYENEQNWILAARTLATIQLESGHRAVPTEYKLRIYTRIAALYLEDGDSVQAEAYVNRASGIVLDTQDKELKLTVKTQMARIEDSKRKFLEAARRYVVLSYEIPDEETRMVALQQAINCALLASAGPERSKVLVTLYKDERTQQLPTYRILEAMYLGRIVRGHEVKAFEAQLQPHQLALTADGLSILEKAVIQHNILSASTIYENISFEQLGTLLNIPAEKAERVTASMISEDRMQGRIDQLKKIIYFTQRRQQIENWDEGIRDVCNQVNTVVQQISQAEPEWVASLS